MEMVNWLGINAFKKQEKNRKQLPCFETRVSLCRAHTSCQSDLDLSFMWSVCDTASQWHLQPTAAILSSAWCAIGGRCVVLLHEHWYMSTGVVRGCVCLLLSPSLQHRRQVSKAQCCHRISSPMIMWGISVIGCHWFYWHLSPQRDVLQHELLKTYTCRSLSSLHQTMCFATLRRARRVMWTAALTLSDNLLSASQHRNFAEVWETWAASVLTPHAELLVQNYCLEKFPSLQGFAKQGIWTLIGELGLGTGRERQTWSRRRPG